MINTPMFSADNIPTKSQNVFEMFDSKADAAVKQLKSHLVMTLVVMFRESKLSQAEFALKANITQPKLSAMLKGRITAISVEAFIKAIITAGGTSCCAFNPETVDACFMITGQK